MKVGAAYDCVMVEVTQVTDVAVMNLVGCSVTVVVCRTMLYIVVVGAVPAKSVVRVRTGAAVMIVVSVTIGMR